MDDEKWLEFFFQLLHRPIPWDPPPIGVKFDDKMMRQFAQMEIKFLQRQTELFQQKLGELAKITAAG